jgi:hypothetical protein
VFVGGSACGVIEYWRPVGRPHIHSLDRKVVRDRIEGCTARVSVPNLHEIESAIPARRVPLCVLPIPSGIPYYTNRMDLCPRVPAFRTAEVIGRASGTSLIRRAEICTAQPTLTTLCVPLTLLEIP